MEYTASLKKIPWRVYQIRVHVNPDGRYGDPWVFGCDVVDRRPPFWKRLWLRLRGRPVEIVAFMSMAQTAPTMGQIEAMKVTLRAAGFTLAIWERRKGSRIYLVRVRL